MVSPHGNQREDNLESSSINFKIAKHLSYFKFSYWGNSDASNYSNSFNRYRR